MGEVATSGGPKSVQMPLHSYWAQEGGAERNGDGASCEAHGCVGVEQRWNGAVGNGACASSVAYPGRIYRFSAPPPPKNAACASVVARTDTNPSPPSPNQNNGQP